MSNIEKSAQPNNKSPRLGEVLRQWAADDEQENNPEWGEPYERSGRTTRAKDEDGKITIVDVQVHRGSHLKEKPNLYPPADLDQW
jgi:hypothetical protein